jgi:hypothetical protein
MACGPLDDEVAPGTEVRQDPLVNGTITYAHPPVGALVNGGSMCTATLVGQRTVLTAAHCIRPGYQHRFVVANTYWRAVSVHRHPNYAPPNTDNDVGVVLLEKEPPVKAASITTRPPKVGQELTLLGYGAVTQSGAGSGTKRVGTNHIAYLTPSRIVISGSSGTNANLCFGDSGGPSFAIIDGHEVQVGIHSTISGTCGSQGHDMRVDIFADWIRTTAKDDVSEDGKPSPLDDTEPPRVVIDSPQAGDRLRGDVKVKATLTDDNGVAQAQLVVDGKARGTREKAPYTFTVKDLEPGTHELVVEARDLVDNKGKASVTITILPPAAFGELCDRHEVCASGICANAGSIVFCTQLCDPAVGCPENAECVAAGNKHVCGPPRADAAEPEQAAAASGCAVSSSRAAVDAWPAALLLLIGLALLLRRRA